MGHYRSDGEGEKTAGWAERGVTPQKGVRAWAMSGRRVRNTRGGEAGAGMTGDTSGDTGAETDITGGADIRPRPRIPPPNQILVTDHTNDTRSRMRWRD